MTQTLDRLKTHGHHRRAPTPNLHQLLGLAQQHLLANRLAQAQACFRRMLRLNPSHRYANLQLSYLSFHSAAYDHALLYCRRVLQSHPQDLIAWAQYLKILKHLDDTQALDRAKAQAQALGLPLGHIELFSKSVGIPQLKRVQDLVEILKQGHALNTEIAARLFIDDHPGHPLGWQVLGEALHDAGDLQAALEIKLKAVAMFPKDANVHNNLARTYLALKDPENALESAKRALEIDPNHQMAQRQCGMAQEALARQPLQPA